jgi:hypothetical protein
MESNYQNCHLEEEFIKKETFVFEYEYLPFSFPLLRDRLENPYLLFDNLKNYIPKITHKPIQYKYILWKTKIYQIIKFKNQNYVSIETQKEDYMNIDRLVDYFNELPRMKARRRDKPYSAFEAWNNKETVLEGWIQNKIQRKESITLLDMREHIWKMGLECNAFKATLAISIYKMFQAKRILDFSAGWGDRLLAAMAYGANRYLGYDPNPDLQKGYQEMRELFTNQNQNQTNYEVKMEAFEEAEIPENETFDLILTSPPYYDFETYISTEKEEAKNQSIVKYPRFHTWMVDFLFTSIQKCWNRLDNGGNMVIHLSDVYKTNYVEAMIIYILGWCKGSRFDGSIASIGDCGKPRPLWVFHKLETTYISTDKTREKMKYYYNELYNLLLQK